MSESRSEPAAAAESGPYVVFARRWYGLADAFPFEKLDNLQDQELPVARDRLAQEHIDGQGGEKEWRAATVKSELRTRVARRKELLSRSRGQPMPPSGPPPHVAPPRVPTAEEIDKYLAGGFKDAGKCLFDVVAGPAGWKAPHGRIIPSDTRTHGESVFLLDGLSARAARLVTQRLNAKHPLEPVTRLRWRFGFVNAGELTDEQHVVVREHLRDPQFGILRSVAEEVLGYVRSAIHDRGAAIGPTSRQSSGGELSRTNAPKRDRVDASFAKYSASTDKTVSAAELARDLDKKRPYLTRHQNPESCLRPDPEKLDIAGRSGSKVNSPLLYTKESVLRFLKDVLGAREGQQEA